MREFEKKMQDKAQAKLQVDHDTADGFCCLDKFGKLKL
jgi:hypothetical protein